MNIKRFLGLTWAAIPTMVGLLYVLSFTALGWYRYIGARGNCWVWSPRLSTCPGFVRNYWCDWRGHTFGNVVVVIDPVDHVVVAHEQKHVEQYMQFGVFFYVVYFLGVFVAWLSGENAYRFNPFEVAARRHAKQPIDPKK